MSNNQKEQAKRREAEKRLAKGVAHFNAWRKGFPTIRVDLTSADFHGLDLAGVDFTRFSLRRANLAGCNLTGALFRGANVNFANLAGANLTGADFQGARLQNAVLSKVTLTDANFYATIRDGWNIDGVICTRCWVRNQPGGGDSIENFQPGEFEQTFGGSRFRVKFPGGFQPVDLLALPFHVRSLLDGFPGRKIVLAGLNTLGETSLEFRIDEMEEGLQGELQRRMDATTDAVRASVVQSYDRLLKQKDVLIEQHSAIIQNLLATHVKPQIVNHFTANVVQQDNSTTEGPRLQIGAGAKVGGSVVIADAITESFTQAKSVSDPTLRNLLVSLVREVEKLSASASPHPYAEMLEHLKQLTARATQKDPPRKWYEVSSKGLIEAAKTCGKMAAPVVKAAKAIAVFLSSSAA